MMSRACGCLSVRDGDDQTSRRSEDATRSGLFPLNGKSKESHMESDLQFHHRRAAAADIQNEGITERHSGTCAPHSHTCSRTDAWRPHLRLLHLGLRFHLRDDFAHVGFQHHAAHHHLGQDVMNLRETRRQTPQDPKSKNKLLTLSLKRLVKVGKRLRTPIGPWR